MYTNSYQHVKAHLFKWNHMAPAFLPCLMLKCAISCTLKNFMLMLKWTRSGIELLALALLVEEAIRITIDIKLGIYSLNWEGLLTALAWPNVTTTVAQPFGNGHAPQSPNAGTSIDLQRRNDLDFMIAATFRWHQSMQMMKEPCERWNETSLEIFVVHLQLVWLRLCRWHGQQQVFHLVHIGLSKMLSWRLLTVTVQLLPPRMLTFFLAPSIWTVKSTVNWEFWRRLIGFRVCEQWTQVALADLKFWYIKLFQLKEWRLDC